MKKENTELISLAEIYWLTDCDFQSIKTIGFNCLTISKPIVAAAQTEFETYSLKTNY